MKLKLSIGIIALFFIMQTSAFAITGQKVYDKYKQSEKKMEKSIKSLIMLLEMDTAGTVVETTIYKKGNKMRVESVIKKSTNPMFGKPGQKSVSIDDGITTTVFHPMMGKVSTPSEKAEDDSRLTKKIKYIDKEKVAGIQCHKIKVRYQSGEQETLWIAAKDYVLVKEKDGEGTTTINSNFKKIKGFRMPHMTQTSVNGSVQATSKVKSAKAGVKIANSKFNPAKVKGFKTVKIPGTGAQPQGDGQMMNMMEMAMEIQRLHMNGETEKAEALTKKMQQMGQQ